MSRFQVRKVAVLGAGVMGAQIAAHLINAKVPVILFDLAAKEGSKNDIAIKAIENLKKLKPAPLALMDDAELIRAANYEENLQWLKECDLVIEAIAERMDWKTDLYHKISPFVAPQAILASNTSGLSIKKLSEALPDSLRSRFCGIHFFNPPRYMHLVELIATPATQPQILDDLEAFCASVLGKGIVRAKDTPNFIANRVGIAGILATMIEAEKFGLTYDEVDDLTGKKLGRASSGTYRTVDVVGLDTMVHVIRTLQETLSVEIDPFYKSFGTPAVLARLIEKGHLGQKTRAGFFKKAADGIERYDATSDTYVVARKKASETCTHILKKPADERLKCLRETKDRQGQFLWAVLRNGFHYVAVHLQEIASTARDIDFAMRWGFGMRQGPFELWQEAGWSNVARMVQADIDAGQALTDAPLPEWVFEGPVANAGAVHTAQGSWNPAAARFEQPRDLAVYKRQYFPQNVYGTQIHRPASSGKTLEESDVLRLWTLDDEVLIASIKTKMRSITAAVAPALQRGITLAEESYQGLVIWSEGDLFSAGEDLPSLYSAAMQDDTAAVLGMQEAIQRLMLRNRYAQIPVVAAINGAALGSGCALAVYSSARVATMESHFGLTEISIGLTPGAGSLTHIARRAAEHATKGISDGLLPFLFRALADAVIGKVGLSAQEGCQHGYLLENEAIVLHKDELLHVAIEQAKAMFEMGYRPPLKRRFKVAGRSATVAIQEQFQRMFDEGRISAHDLDIAAHMAYIVAGGNVDADSLVSEDYLMQLERDALALLIRHPKTRERLAYTLKNGKSLRN